MFNVINRTHCRTAVKNFLMRIHIVVSLLFISSNMFAQTPDPGRRAFDTICARCHGGDGNGGEMGPPILMGLPGRDDQQLISLIRNGIPTRGMPGSKLDESTLTSLVAHLRSIQSHGEPVEKRKVAVAGGGTLEGQ